MAKRRQYTEEFKHQAVLLCGSGGSVGETARDLGIDASMLRHWVRNERAKNPDGAAVAADSGPEMQRLRAELRKVTMERDILKKALSYFAKNPP